MRFSLNQSSVVDTFWQQKIYMTWHLRWNQQNYVVVIWTVVQSDHLSCYNFVVCIDMSYADRNDRKLLDVTVNKAGAVRTCLRALHVYSKVDTGDNMRTTDGQPVMLVLLLQMPACVMSHMNDHFTILNLLVRLLGQKQTCQVSHLCQSTNSV